MTLIDPTTAFGARVEERLRTESIAWLTTVRPDGLPQPIPVWFLWNEADEVLIFSRPDALKLRNLSTNPKASLHFDGDGRGGNIVVISGTARVADSEVSPERVDAFLTKYVQGIKSIGLTPESMKATYSTALLFSPERVSGH